jgi:hypothetical protein
MLAAVNANAEPSDIHVQLVNPDARMAVRVFLDQKQVYFGKPAAATSDSLGAPPTTVGTIKPDGKQRHVIIVEAPDVHVKARFDWVRMQSPDGWIVIRYVPGRSDANEPSYFAFSMQSAPAALK